MVLSSAKVIGLAVKLAIEELDQKILGTDVKVGQAVLALCRGYVLVEDLEVMNPTEGAPEGGWASEHLIKVGRLVLNVNVWALLKSLGKRFEISVVALQDVDVVYEKGWGVDSNVAVLIAHLTKHDENTEKPPEKPKPEPEKKKPEPAKPKDDKEKEGGGTEILLRTLDISNVGARIVSTGMGTVFSAPLGDIHYDDFAERMKQSGDKMVVGDIVAEILKTLCKAVLQNTQIMGHLAGAAAKNVAHAVGEGVSGFFHRLSGRGSVE